MTTSQILQIAFILATLVFVLYVGNKAGGQVKDHTDFHLAGRQMSWLIIAAGLVGTNFSGAVITTVASLTYQYGLSGIWFECSTIIGFIICALIYAKRVRLTGAFTISELFELRYSFETRLIAGFFIMASGIAAAAAQFKAIGLIVNSLFGIPEIAGVLIAWLVIVIYMTMAGFWATNLTSLPQLFFCFIGFPAVLFWGIATFGGPAEVMATIQLPEKIGEAYFGLTAMPLLLVLTWVLQWMFINEWGSQWYFQRASAARNVKHARIGFWMTAIGLTILVLLPGTGIGFYARIIDPNLANPEMALSLVISKAPAVLSAFAAAGIFAAVMSTVDACSMGAITVVARDFYHRTLRPHATPKEVTFVSRIITIVVLVTVLLAATALSSALQGLNFIFVFNTGIFGALLGALFWKKACKEAAIISILSAGVTSTVWTYMGYGKIFWGAWWSLLLSVSLMIIISLIVDKTGPWWGTEKEVSDPATKEKILTFMDNRNVTMADIIDRTGAHASVLRPALNALLRAGTVREIGYMTFSLSKNSTPEQEFTADNSSMRTAIMVGIMAISIIAFLVVCNLTIWK